MMKYIFYLFIGTSLLLTSCNGESADNSDATSTTPAAPTTADANTEPTYPTLPLERLEYLWDNATYSDATFYYLPISTNQSDLSQIRSTLSFVADQAPVIDPACKPIAHLWFQVNGKNQEEADLFFSEGCIFFLWYDNGKPAYANLMTQTGVEFYNRVIASVPPDAGQ